MEVGKSPQMAVIIESIIKSMGVDDFDPSVVQQLLEFVYRDVTSTIEEGKVFAKHANKKFLDGSDVTLALKMKSEVGNAKVGPMTTSSLKELARVQNSVPLGFIKPKDGLRLPADRYCFTAVNYKLKPPVRGGELSQTVNRSALQNWRINGKSGLGGRPVIAKRPPVQKQKLGSSSVPAFKPVLKFSSASSVASEVKSTSSIPVGTQPEVGVEIKTESPSVDMETEASAKRKCEFEDHDYDLDFLLS